jgi:hypothetical protein
MYKISKNSVNQNIISIELDGVLKSFTEDSSNTDYQEYLAWKEKGNEPLPADEPASQPADE